VLPQFVSRVASTATGTEPALVFGAIGRHPRLFRAWLPFAATLLLRGDLRRADTELVVLRTAWNCRCWDEWRQHSALALRAGLTTEDIEAVSEGPAAARWPDRQRCLLQAADDLHRDRALDPRTHKTLDELFSERQRVEICLLVGHYEMLAMLLNSDISAAAAQRAE
jgi:alkylhydroperoxidase family enzyme